MVGDVDGTQLATGDIVEIVQMDDPTYADLVGVRGVVDALSQEEADKSVFVVLEHARVPAISTQRAWVRKVV